MSILQQFSNEQLLQSVVGERQAVKLKEVPLRELFAERIRFGSFQDLGRRDAVIQLQAAAELFQRSQKEM